MAIEYAEDGSVSVSVKLQELFGLGDTPRLGPAGTPITFHLLAPNGRPVQTTQDLKSFWDANVSGSAQGIARTISAASVAGGSLECAANASGEAAGLKCCVG